VSFKGSYVLETPKLFSSEPLGIFGIMRCLHFLVLNHRDHRGEIGKLYVLRVLCGEFLSGATKSAKALVIS
jgi:hypothetical protein